MNNGYFPIAFFSESVNSRFIVENADYLIGANPSYPIQNRYKCEFSYLSKIVLLENGIVVAWIKSGIKTLKVTVSSAVIFPKALP